MLEGPAQLDLEEPFAAFAVGGAGRYWVFHQKAAKKLVLLDISAAEITHEIDAPGDDLRLAAGLDKLIVVVAEKNLINRYSLPELTREKSAPNFGAVPIHVLLGSASSGPLGVFAERGPIKLLDLNTLKPLTIKAELPGGDPMYGFTAIVSSDGQTFCGWEGNISPTNFTVFHLQGTGGTRKETEAHSGAGRWIRPSYDGSLLFQNGGHVYPRTMKMLSPEQFRGIALYPAEDPRYFIALRPAEGDRNADATICTAGGLEQLARIDNLGKVAAGNIASSQGHWHMQPRVRYIPSANVIVSIPEGEQTILLTPANLTELLAEVGDDYLHIVSVPPPIGWVGKAYPYQLELLTSVPADQVTYKVESGPTDFKISPEGRVLWTPKQRAVGGVESVVISATGPEGLEALQSFDITIERPSRTTVAARPSSPAKSTAKSSPAKAAPAKTTTAGAPAAPPAEMPDEDPAAAETTAPVETAADEPVQVSPHLLEIPKGEFTLSKGLADRTLLLLQGDKLTILGPDGIQPIKTIKLPKVYQKIAERADYWVGVTHNPTGVEVLDKRTLAVRGTTSFHAMRICDIVLHPKLPVAYVAYQARFDLPGFQFIVYQESKGEGREGDDYIGSTLAIDPEGKFLTAGYYDVYKKGSELLFNPGQVHVVPTYGSLDWLITYQLDKTGMPGKSEIKEKAGGNGHNRGMRLSPDGKRVTYLSVVGSPPHSHNLLGWDPLDLKKLPVTYATHNVAATDYLAFHPFLPLVGCVSPSNVGVIYQRESGQLVPDKVDEGEVPSGEKMHNVYFSPDGKSMIFDTSVNEIRYLRRVELKLTSAELRQVETAFSKLAIPSPAADLASAPSPTAGLRTWTDTTGQFKIEAKMVGMIGNSIRLAKADGTIVNVPLDKLSPADVAAARQFTSSGGGAASATATSASASPPPGAGAGNAAVEELVRTATKEIDLGKIKIPIADGWEAEYEKDWYVWNLRKLEMHPMDRREWSEFKIKAAEVDPPLTLEELVKRAKQKDRFSIEYVFKDITRQGYFADGFFIEGVKVNYKDPSKAPILSFIIVRRVGDSRIICEGSHYLPEFRTAAERMCVGITLP
jgi:hypothetical protein